MKFFYLYQVIFGRCMHVCQSKGEQSQGVITKQKQFFSNYWMTLPRKTVEHASIISADTRHPSFESIQGCQWRLQLASWLCNTNDLRAVNQLSVCLPSTATSSYTCISTSLMKMFQRALAYCTYRSCIQFDLEFENAGFSRGRKTGVPEETPWNHNKLNHICHMAPGRNQT